MRLYINFKQMYTTTNLDLWFRILKEKIKFKRCFSTFLALIAESDSFANFNPYLDKKENQKIVNNKCFPCFHFYRFWLAFEKINIKPTNELKDYTLIHTNTTDTHTHYSQKIMDQKILFLNISSYRKKKH